MAHMVSVPGTRWIACLAFLIQYACTNKEEKHQGSNHLNESIPPAVMYQRSFSDSLTVTYPCAVFYSPDSLQLEKIKANTDANVFQTMTHENFYLVKNARQVLQLYYPDIKIVEADKNRFIVFDRKDADNIVVDLNNSRHPFGLYIFDGKKPPILTDMANIATDLGFYFDRSSLEKEQKK